LAGIDADDGLVGGRVGAVQRSAVQPPPTAWRERRQPTAADVPQDVPAAEMPEWLARLAARRNAAASAAAAPPAADEDGSAAKAADGALPGWLRAEVDRDAAYAVPAAADESPTESGRSADAPTLDWLRDIEEAWAAETRRNAVAASGTELPPDPDAAPDIPAVSALVPEWLQPAEPRRSPPPADPARAILQRAGLLPPRVDGIAQQPAARIAPRRSPETQAAIDALSELVRADAAHNPPPTGAVRPAGERFAPVIPLLLLLAALLIVLLPSAPVPAPTDVAAAPIAAAAAGLSRADTVVVAVEWGAPRAPQLRTLSEQLLTELSRRGVRTVIVATDPVGAVMSAALAAHSDTAAADAADAVAPEVVGFLPGGDLAVRRLAADAALSVDAATRILPLPAATAPTAVLVLGDDLQDVQAWIEQWWVNQPQVPLTFLLPPDVAVQALPYQGIDGVTLLHSSNSAALHYGDVRLLQAAFAAAVLISVLISWAVRAAAQRRGRA
jgi:hypothetical protein